MSKKQKFFWMVAVFVFFYSVPFSSERVKNAILEAFYMAQDYAQHHVLLCLVPAFFIAGAIANFISQQAVIKYLGSRANQFLAYTLASVSGTILAVCSCTVLPLFAGIYTRGAGIGPAVAFLYSGPAINILAIILTARVLGLKLGIARAVGAILFSIVIGLLMSFIFGNPTEDTGEEEISGEEDTEGRRWWQDLIYFLLMVGILVFANWSGGSSLPFWQWIYKWKWVISGILFVLLIFVVACWFKKEEIDSWFSSTWEFAEQILPLLFGGVLVAGFLLGRPGHQALIPPDWVYKLVGGNSLGANFFASIAGAFMYFATLTEIPILQGLLGSGMGEGPALALLLAGPALSLPNMLVIKSIMGWKRTLVYITLVVVMATITGFLFGKFFI